MTLPLEKDTWYETSGGSRIQVLMISDNKVFALASNGLEYGVRTGKPVLRREGRGDHSWIVRRSASTYKAFPQQPLKEKLGFPIVCGALYLTRAGEVVLLQPAPTRTQEVEHIGTNNVMYDRCGIALTDSRDDTIVDVAPLHERAEFRGPIIPGRPYRLWDGSIVKFSMISEHVFRSSPPQGLAIEPVEVNHRGVAYVHSNGGSKLDPTSPLSVLEPAWHGSTLP
jgi:hypothetical protein